MFSIILKDQKLPGYAELLTVEVNVQSILIVQGNMQVQWSIDLPKANPRLPGTEQLPPLFKGNLDMVPLKAILDGLRGFFSASVQGLVNNLNIRAEAAAKAEADALAAAEAAAKAAEEAANPPSEETPPPVEETPAA